MNNFDFYNMLDKPSYAPDKKVFGRVWALLYFLLFISFLNLYFQPLSILKIFGILLFSLQFLLNLSWVPVFFKLKKIKLAFIICLVLLITVILMTILFFRLSVILGILQIPYIIWLVIATKLNYDIMNMNLQSS